ncbi:MAG TPA: amidohydrolase family protein [Chloroflexota bacterium]
MSASFVVDADGHCQEPEEGLAQWLPDDYARHAPIRVKDDYGNSRIILEGRVWSKSGHLGSGVQGPFAPHIVGFRPGMRDAQQRLVDMDEEGIDVAIIFGTSIALTVNGLEDKGLAGAICHAVNRWLVEEYLAADRKRLKGVGLIPCQDPAAAARELGYLAQHRQDGIVSAMLPTNVYGINLGDRRFDPIYAAAQEIGIPLSVHPQTGHDGVYGVNGVMGAGSERMDKYSYVHITAFVFELMIALMHQIGEGVFDRFPGLKVAYMEGGAGWIPFWAERLDEHQGKLRPQWPDLRRKPSEIIASPQVSFTCEPEEATLPYVLDHVGLSQVMYASDYAHWDCEFPESVRLLKSIPGMTDEHKRRVLGENAIEWFGLQPAELPERALVEKVAV